MGGYGAAPQGSRESLAIRRIAVAGAMGLGGAGQAKVACGGDCRTVTLI